MDFTQVYAIFCSDLRTLTVETKARLELGRESLPVVLDQYYLDIANNFSRILKSATPIPDEPNARPLNLMVLFNVFCEETQRRLTDIKEPLVDIIRTGAGRAGLIVDQFYLSVVRDLAYYLSVCLDNGQPRSVTVLEDDTILVRNAALVDTGYSVTGSTDLPENPISQIEKNVSGRIYNCNNSILTRPSIGDEPASPIPENMDLLNPNMVVDPKNSVDITDDAEQIPMDNFVTMNNGNEMMTFSPISSTNLPSSELGDNDDDDVDDSALDDGRDSIDCCNGLFDSGEDTTNIDSSVHYSKVDSVVTVATSTTTTNVLTSDNGDDNVSNRVKRQKVDHELVGSRVIKTEENDDKVFIIEKKSAVTENPVLPVNPVVSMNPLVPVNPIKKEKKESERLKNRIQSSSMQKSNNTSIRCHICFQTFTSSRIFLRHVEAGHEETLFGCTWPDCGTKVVDGFKTHARALAHVRTVHFKLPASVKMEMKLRTEGKLIGNVEAVGVPADYIVVQQKDLEVKDQAVKGHENGNAVV